MQSGTSLADVFICGIFTDDLSQINLFNYVWQRQHGYIFLILINIIWSAIKFAIL